jgi:hypothetical protein
MAGYNPLRITGNATGLVQEREEFILPDDAYPTLINAYVWRERIKRKRGYRILGRLQRKIGTTDGAGNATITINPHPMQTGIASFTVGTALFNDPGTTANPGVQTLLTTGPGTATLDRVNGILTIAGTAALSGLDVQYFPGLPVMGIRQRELANSADDQTIFFDQDYAYIFNGVTGQFEEFIGPGKTWNKQGENTAGTSFFWSTNYWTSQSPTPPFSTINRKLFWETNNTGQFGANADPPRITDGDTWVDFYNDANPLVVSPWARINIDTTGVPFSVFLTNFLCMLPFRGRMVVFNTWEGPNAANSQNFSNRIRWSTIGNPFIGYADGPGRGSWRENIRGQGGFLDIPTSEDIIAVGFVRDNLVIYCERSTWQLRYTGRSISPFQIERVNSELGAESTFSAVQFDTSLVGIGDKGITECDSYKSERIDIKIPDFVDQFNALNNGVKRVQGIRNFPDRLAYWTIPLVKFYPNIANTSWVFPTARLVYNYENDSWAIFNDSLTALGTFQLQSSPNWLQTPQTWIELDRSWLDDDVEDFVIVGGNQQGFVERLDQTAVNDVSLFISNVVTTGPGPTVITSPSHNMQNGFVIGISGIPATTPGSDLNGGVYAISAIDQHTFTLLSFNPNDAQFDLPVTSTLTGTYQGGGLINIRENFSIVSKKFNFLDEGQNIQLGYLDILMEAIGSGEISLNIYLNYDDETPSNTLPNNQIAGTSPAIPDTFFNATIPTSPSSFAVANEGTKFWQRVFCATRANFLTLQYTFSNLQMAGTPQQKAVQIDAQVLWIRKGGRMTQF